jgi:hypothetical protein
MHKAKHKYFVYHTPMSERKGVGVEQIMQTSLSSIEERWLIDNDTAILRIGSADDFLSILQCLNVRLFQPYDLILIPLLEQLKDGEQMLGREKMWH